MMNKLAKILSGIIVVLLTIIIVLMIMLGKKERLQYDVSNFHEVNVSDILKMFEDKSKHVVLFGYEDCDVCINTNPILEQAQAKYDYMTSYIDITKIDYNSEDWKKLVKLLDLEDKQVIKDTLDAEEGTFGYFLDNYGLAPTVIVVEDNKQKGGFIGGYDEKYIMSWFEYILNK